MKMTWKGRYRMIKILLIVLILLAAAFVAGICWLAGFTMTGKRQTLDEAMAWQSAHYDTSFYEKLEKEDYLVKGEGGYELHVQLLKNPVPSKKYVILSHGYTDNRIGDLKYASIYLELGFNCILYDLRGHGLNAPDITTYGILEAKDLLKLIEDTRARYPEIESLGLHGESLGSATTITCLQYRPEVDFAVADCGFSDLENVLRGGYKSANVPGFLFELTDLGAKLRYHYSLKDMRPIDALDDNEVPILFLHGAADSFILPENSKRMYERTKGYRELHYLEGAEHAVSAIKQPEAYARHVREFLTAIGQITE